MLPVTIWSQLPETGGNKAAYTAFRAAEKKFYKGNLLSGERTFERSANRYESNGNVDGYIAAKAMEAIVLLNQDRPKEAFKAFRYAEELFDAQEQQNEVTKAYLSLCLGKYHLYYKETEEANVFLSQADAILKNNPDYVSAIFEVELQQSMGKLYMQKGQNQEALGFYDKLIEASNRADAVGADFYLSDAASDVMDNIYDDMAAPDEAVTYYRKRLSTKGSAMNSRERSKTNFKAGQNSFKFTDYESAYDFLMNALNGELSLADEAKTKSMLATISMSMRDYKDALEKNGDALRIQLEIGASADDLFDSFLKQGKICQELEEIGNSVYWYKKTVKNIDEDWNLMNELSKYELEGIQHSESATLNTSFNVALLHYERAERLLSQLNPKHRLIGRIEIYMAKGNLYFKAGYMTSAEQYYGGALALIESNYAQKFNLLSETARYLAAIYAEQGRLQLADRFANKAMNAALKKGQRLEVNNLPASTDVIEYRYEMLYAMAVKASILHQIYAPNPDEENMQEPLKFIDFAMQLINEMKKTHRHESAKYELSELTEEINHQALASTYVLYQLSPERTYLEKVFQFMEQAKSSLLLQAVQQMRAQRVINVPSEVIEKEQMLKTKMAYYVSEIHYETQLGKDSDSERVAALQDKLKEVRAAYPDYLEYIHEQYPKYYALKYEPQLATLQELQNELRENETFMNYVVVDSVIHILQIQNNKVTYVNTNSPDDIRQAVSKYIASLKGESVDDFLKYSNIFYEALIAPVRDKMMQKDLIIIPDGVLNYLPFEIVPTEVVPQSVERGDYSIYKKMPYLLKASTVVYNYSATLFLESRRKVIATKMKGFVGYAPDFTDIESFMLTQKHQKSKYEDLLLEPLDNAAKEVAMIGELTEGKTWIGYSATETAFKQDATQYGVVHFATHGILNNKFPLYSNLVLLGDDKEDGLLHTYELYNMEINAELVALSACNTGVGRIQKGEGAMSIARGFAYAGCPNIAMTLWPVSDQATQILMSNFYSNMMLGMSKAEALRQAKLHFIETGTGLITTPYFWSGMLIVGTPDSLHTLRTLPYYQRHPWLVAAMIGLSVLLLIALTSFIIYRKKKS